MDLKRIEELVPDWEDFASNSFGKKPVLHIGAVIDRLDMFVSSDQLLSDIVTLETLPMAYLRLVKNGKVIPHTRFTKKVQYPGQTLAEVLDPAKLNSQFHDGATVICNYLNHFLPSMRRLSSIVNEKFGCQSEAAAFLTPPQSRGLSPHCDPVDVFVVHLEGTKTWRVWNPLPPGQPAPQDHELGTPLLETTLQPGDVLYIPVNTPHSAAALDTASLHISLSVEPRTWRDIVRECVNSLLNNEQHEGFTYLGGADNTAQALAQRLDFLRRQIGSLNPAEEIQLARSHFK